MYWNVSKCIVDCDIPVGWEVSTDTVDPRTIFYELKFWIVNGFPLDELRKEWIYVGGEEVPLENPKTLVDVKGLGKISLYKEVCQRCSMTDITEEFQSLQLSSLEGENELFDIASLFAKGTAGRTAFEEHIVPFLTLTDLINTARTCHWMNVMCRTYTIGDILERYKIVMSREDKMELGKLVIVFIGNERYNGAPSGRARRRAMKSNHCVHRRRIADHTGTFKARLYHPSQMPQLELALAAYCTQNHINFNAGISEFNWERNSDVNTPVLLSARYGLDATLSFDVTVILLHLLMKQGNTWLILKNTIDGPVYWYNCFFGDPVPRKQKVLCITQRQSDGRSKTITFSEDQPFKMKIRAEFSTVEAAQMALSQDLHISET